MTNVLRVILSGVAAKDPGQTPCVILSEATLVAKSKDLGGPALPRRHALFCGQSKVPSAGSGSFARLTKPSRFPLGVIPAFEPESSLAAPVSSPRGHDRCRETLEEAA